MRNDLGKLVDTQAPALFVVLSTESSWSLADGFDALAETRALFHKRSWLSAISTSWLRVTELTHRSGLWHPHDQYVVFGSLADLNTVRDEVADRWATAAAQAGHTAAAHAQYAEFARSTEATFNYTTKGLMHPSHDAARFGRTPADILVDYKLGDADAADQWGEIENLLASGRAPRLVARGGALRSTGAAA